jgi:hypothetical protein
MPRQEVVHANLADEMPQQARTIIDAMHAVGLKRLIFVSSMGIYGEVPGETYRSILGRYRDSAAEIEILNRQLGVFAPSLGHDIGP